MERLEERSLLAGLISWWTADNTAADSVGTNHGTLTSGATFAAGQIGQAFSFDGVNDRVQIADSESLKLTSSMTIEGWVKANSLPVQQGEILFRGDDRGGLDPDSLSVQSNGSLRFEVAILSGAMSLSTTMPLSQFVHVAGTLDDATGEILRYGTTSEAVFTVSLSAPFPTAASVSFSTTDDSAIAGSDYTMATGTVTFAPGMTLKTIRVPILDDTAYEPNESFNVILSSPVGATIADGKGIGTITDDDIRVALFGNDDDTSMGTPFLENVAMKLREVAGIEGINRASLPRRIRQLIHVRGSQATGLNGR